MQKNFFETCPKFSEEAKNKAILMYVNNVGVRKIALFIGCSRTTISNWVKKARERLDKMLDKSEPNYSEKVDIIELDEIYTYVKKTVQSGSVACLFSTPKAYYFVPHRRGQACR